MTSQMMNPRDNLVGAWSFALTASYSAEQLP
jgi:hypothetical protein